VSRILFVAFLLVGCGCAQQPIAPESQAQVSVLASTYALAHKIEMKHCQMEKLPQTCIAVRKMGYEAEATFTTANSERTQQAIVEAQRKMMAYATAAQELL
jgi:hypothetical protein